MQNHLASHHPVKYGESGKGSSKSQQHKMESFVTVKKCPAERAEEITGRIAEMVARDLQPICIIEGEGFLRYIEPSYCVPSHTHTHTVCHCVYETQLRENSSKRLVVVDM